MCAVSAPSGWVSSAVIQNEHYLYYISIVGGGQALTVPVRRDEWRSGAPIDAKDVAHVATRVAVVQIRIVAGLLARHQRGIDLPVAQAGFVEPRAQISLVVAVYV